MKNLYLLALTGLLATGTAHAQQPWQPFRPSLSYQYHEAATAGDTTHVLRLAAGAPAPGSTTDSLFRFNDRVGRNPAPGAADCNGRYRLRPDNLFGATLRSQPRAVFTLAAANGRTLTLRPRTAPGSSWATGLPGLTAQVTARTMAPVLGSVTADSVATITFSDGRSLRLSKSYGVLDGPSLDSYLNGRNPRRVLTLSALPERGLGTALTTDAALYNYQPGDVLQYVSRNFSTGAGQDYLCQQYWTQDSVLTRELSANGDTLVYTLRRRQRQQGYGFPNAPAGFCSTPRTSTVFPPRTTKLRVFLRQPAQLTSYFQVTATGNPYGNVMQPLSTNATRLGGQAELSAFLQVICDTSSPDSVVLRNEIDNSGIRRFAVGLGFIYSRSNGIYGSDETELTAYRKGTQQWGALFQPGLLLAARAVQPATTTSAFPTPFAESLTVAFVLASPQPVEVSLHDALGRLVRQVPPQALAAGPRQLLLSTAELPTGLYTVHLRFVGENRSEVLKVVK